MIKNELKKQIKKIQYQKNSLSWPIQIWIELMI